MITLRHTGFLGSCATSWIVASLVLVAQAAGAQLPSYTGGIYGNAGLAHDSRLRWAVGVQNVQVVRSAPDNPGQTDGDSTFFRHHVDMVYWNGRFWSMHYGASKQLNWSTNGLDWNPSVSASALMPGGPPRMSFYVASNGRLLALGWDGVGHRGDWLVREIFGPNGYGTVYSIKTNYIGRDPNNNWPSYTISTSSGFRSACAELRNNPLYCQQWQEDDEEDPAFYTVNLNTIPGITEWKAFNWYRLADNRIVGAWKGASGSKKIYLAVSTGTNWIPGGVPTPVTDATFGFKDNAKTWGARTEDGRYAMIGCLDLTRRWPLAVTTSADGWTFDTPYLIIAGDMPMQRYEESRTVYGDAKNTGPQYVRGLTPGNGDPPGTDLWLTYSMNKEDIWVASVPTPIIGQVTNDVRDDFQSHAVGRRIAGWNTYSPQWAPVAIAAEGTNRFVRLEDRDPCDYASVMRVFPQSSLARVVFQVRAHQTNASSAPLEIDVVSGNGSRAVALALNPTNGQLTAWNGGSNQNVRAYTTHRWISVELIVNGPRRVYDLTVDGVNLLKDAAFLETASGVERIVFRTGAFRLRDFTRRPDDDGLPNRIPAADVMQPTTRYDLDNISLISL